MPQKLRFKEAEWLAEAEQLVKPILGVWLEDSICDLQIIAQSLQQNKWDEIVSQLQNGGVDLSIVTIF